MKSLILLSVLSLTAYAGDRPEWHPGQDQGQDHHTQAQHHGGSHHHPQPQQCEYQCQVYFVDCRNEPIYVYTGTDLSYKGACKAAWDTCNYDVRHEGQDGDHCVMMGK